MKAVNRFVLLFSLTLFFSRCSSDQNNATNSPGLEITMNSDSSAVQLENISPAAFQELKTDTLTLHQWQSIFAVYEAAEDDEQNGLQQPLKGAYELHTSKAAFVPTEKFQKGKTYLVQCYVRKLQFEPEQIATRSRNLFKQEIIEKKISF